MNALEAFVASPANVLPPQAHLNAVRGFYGVPQGTPVISDVRVNSRTMRLTDLDPQRFDTFVHPIHIDDILTAPDAESLTEHQQIARLEVTEVIRRRVRAALFAKRYTPWVRTANGDTFVCANNDFPLHARWSRRELTEAYRLLDEAGVFELKFDPVTGIVVTSDTINEDMTRIWTTDGMIAGRSLADLHPDAYRRSMVTHASLLCIPSSVGAAFQAALNSLWYRQRDPRHGVPHIFLHKAKNGTGGLQWDETQRVPLLETQLPDDAWSNNQRLESQAMLLESLVRGLLNGSRQRKRDEPITGLWWEAMTGAEKQRIVTSIQVAATYLLAVQWNPAEGRYDFRGETASSWEEEPIPGGCASDTGFGLDAAFPLRTLLFDPHVANWPAIAEIRKEIGNLGALHWEGRNGEELFRAAPWANFTDSTNLGRFLDSGSEQLHQMVINPVLESFQAGGLDAIPHNIRQFQHRGPDSSLTLLAAYHRQFGRTPLEDAMVRLQIVRFVRAHLIPTDPLQRYGMHRYGLYRRQTDNQGEVELLDSYLNLDFELGLVAPGLVSPKFRRIVDRQRSQLESGAIDVREQRYWQQTIELWAGANAGVNACKDATNAGAMALRQQFSVPALCAQWSIGTSACLNALAKARRSVLAYRGNDQGLAWELLERIEREYDFFLNLSLATIVANRDSRGNTVLRADGTELPAPFNIMEAFQATAAVGPDGSFQRIDWLPGDHTLTWSMVQTQRSLRGAIAA